MQGRGKLEATAALGNHLLELQYAQVPLTTPLSATRPAIFVAMLRLRAGMEMIGLALGRQVQIDAGGDRGPSSIGSTPNRITEK